MKAKSIYVNLPIEDVKKTRDFWTKLGFSFNESFSDEKALCLEFAKDLIYAMFLRKEFFSTFTNRSIADSSVTQTLLAVEVDSKDDVNKIVKLALENGATRYKDAADHGWMYYDSFADPDGHQWEIMWSDASKLPAQQQA